jgi:predicted ATPase
MIQKIEVSNFKCFINQPFNLANLTAFAGINGVGKSTIIQSLLLLRQSFESTLLQIQNKVDLFNYSFIDLESAENLCNINAYPKTVSIKIDTTNSGHHEWIIDASKPKEKILPAEYKGNGGFEKDPLFTSRLHYLTSERIGPRKRYFRSAERVFNSALGIQGELTAAYIFNALRNNEEIGIANLKHPSASSTQLYENINLWLSEIVNTSITTRVSEESEESLRLTYNIKGSNGGEFSAMQVAFGYSYNLPVIVAVLIAKKEEIIIIENPESHFHPSSQSKVGQLLVLAAQNGIQVIVETHSEHVINGFRIQTILRESSIDSSTIINFVHRDAALNSVSVKPIGIEDSGDLTKFPQGFFDQLQHDMAIVFRLKREKKNG